MRIHLTILAAGAMCAALTAQTTYQSWDMHPGSTSFTSRGNIGSGSGSIYQGVHSATNRGVLDVGGKCVIGRFNTISQDQNCSSQEKFGFVVRSGTDATGPFTTSGAVLGRVTGLSTPKASNSACAFSITTTLTPRARIAVPCERMWGYGLELPPAPGWVANGLSTHATRGAPSSAPLHNSHSGQADQAWQIIGTASTASNVSNKRSWRLTVFGVDNAVMKLRCGGRQGYGGSYPKASTSTAPLAWDVRLNGGANCSGAASVICVGSSRTSGVAMPPALAGGARLYIAGPFLCFLGGTASTSGVVTIPILPFIPASASGVGTFHLQGALDAGGGSAIKLTNSQSVIP